MKRPWVRASTNLCSSPVIASASEAIHIWTEQGARWIASSLALLAMTTHPWPAEESIINEATLGEGLYESLLLPRHCERKRSNPYLDRTRCQMDCFVACAPRNDDPWLAGRGIN